MFYNLGKLEWTKYTLLKKINLPKFSIKGASYKTEVLQELDMYGTK